MQREPFEKDDVSFGIRAGRAVRGWRGFLFVGVVSAGLAGGMACSSGDDRAATGTKGGACYPNGTCNDGLSCASDLCVALGGSDDAAKTPSDDAAKSQSAATCKQGERATDFASCTSDDECFSGYCCKRGVYGCGKQGDYPGYCIHPSTTAYKAGHGYSCETTADCEAVAPDFIARGGTARCYKDNLNDVPNGCGFDCSSPTHDPTVTSGTSTGGGPVSGAGGAPGTAAGTTSGAGGSAQGVGGATPGAGGSAQNVGGARMTAGGNEQSGGGEPSSAGGRAQGGGGAPSGAGGSVQSAAGAASAAGGGAQSGGGGPSGAAGGTSSANGGRPGAGGGTQSGGGAPSGTSGASSHT